MLGHVAANDVITLELVSEFMGGGNLHSKIALFGALGLDVGPKQESIEATNINDQKKTEKKKAGNVGVVGFLPHGLIPS